MDGGLHPSFLKTLYIQHRYSGAEPAPYSDTGPESRRGGEGKCSAVEDYARRGTCPQLESGLGMAESPVRIRRIKSQLRVFIPCVPAQAGMGDWYENDRTS